MRCSFKKFTWGSNNLYKDALSRKRVVQVAELIGGSQRVWTTEQRPM